MSRSVFFLGTSPFAIPCLRALAGDKRFDVRLVITQPDRPVGRKQLLTPPPVKTAATELGLVVEQPEKINSQFSIFNSQFSRPDFLVVVSYGQILSDEILSVPTIAAVNVHASLLPALRGASPIQHAILEGMTETGVTVQRMAHELDAGPVLAQEKLTIDPRETFATLHDRLAVMGASLLVETLSKPLNEHPQDHSKATFCKKFSKEDGVADPKTMTAEQIDRMVRALTPWPGVSIGGHKILATELSAAPDSFPVACAQDTTIFVTRIQPPSGTPMGGRAFASGHPSLLH